MRSKLLLGTLAALLMPMSVHAGPCTPPPFPEFAPAAGSTVQNTFVPVVLSMQPVASLRIPAGFSTLGAQPHGTVVFGKHPDGISGGIAYETTETVSPHRKGVTPAEFFQSIFHGIDKPGCDYLAALQLEHQDYRLHMTIRDTGEVFAYGKGDQHHFYIIRQDQPDFVLNGLFRGIDRSAFETILSTITFQ